jgi:FecR protein
MRLPRIASNTRFALVNAALIVVGMMTSASYVLAQTVGTITRLEGTAQILRSVNTLPATLSMPIMLHDRINTGANTYLTVTMMGGSSMTLASNSTLTIDESTAIGGVETPTKVGLLTGHLHTLITDAMRTGSPTAFEVHTPNAVGAVRGTEWDEEYEEGTPKSDRYKTCLQYTEVWVEDGCVHVWNPGISGDPGQDACKGQYVKVPCGYAPMGAEAAGGLGGAATFATLGAIAAGAAIAGGVVAATSGGGGSGGPPPPPPSSSK